MSRKATRREWIGLAVIALPCLLYAMDLTVLNLAVPRLAAQMHPTSTQLLWIIDIYGFLVAGSLIPMGALGDRIGRRRLLLIGAAAFGAVSIVAAFAGSPNTLIASRALLGLAGATLAPSTLSLIRNMFEDERERSFAIGAWIASYSAGSAIGPLVGGIVLGHFWPGAVFLIGVPVMVLLLIVGPLLLPEFRAETPDPLDWRGSLLALGGVLSFVFGVKRIAVDGIAISSVAAIVAGVLLARLYVRRQPELAPSFRTSWITYMLATFASFGVYVITAQYLQLVLGLTPLQAGLTTLPFSAAFIVGSLVTSRLTRRFAKAHVITGGLVLAAAGYALLGLLDPTAGVVPVLVAFTLTSLGSAPVFALATDLIIGSVPPERAGTAAALSETGSELGGALGIAILGSIGNAVLRHDSFTAAVRVVGVVAAVVVLALALLSFTANLRSPIREACVD